MSAGRMIELAVAVAILGAAVWLYRRRSGAPGPNNDGYGSQGAVVLLVVAVIIGIHALGGLDYHPSQAELEAIKGAAR